MAVKSFQDVYAQLSADERKILDNVFAKEPELKDGWLRQDDYGRKMTEIKAKTAEFDEAVAYKTKMEPWAETAYERIKRLEEAGVLDAEGNELWTSQKTQLEKDIEEARAAAVAGGEMDPKELEKRVREIVTASGGVTKEELNALVQAEAKKLVTEQVNAGFKEKENDFNTKTIPFVAGFSAATAVVAGKYEKETGEAWTKEKQEELFALMGKEQNFDPFVVGEKMLAPVREKKARADEIEKEVQKRLSERGMPGGGGEDFIPNGGGNQPLGSLQAAQAMVQEGKF